MIAMRNHGEVWKLNVTILDDDDEDPIFIRGKRSSANNHWCGKFMKSVGLTAAFLSLGLCLALLGPTLIDLKEHVHTDLKHISYIFIARSIGYLVGSILGGILFDHFDQQLQLTCILLLTSIATTTVPWCTSLTVLAAMISFQGISMGVLDTGGNVFCIRIWGHKSGPYLQAMHFAFGVGAFIAPLLARPFLSTAPMHNSSAGNLLPRGQFPVIPHSMHPQSAELIDSNQSSLNSTYQELTNSGLNGSYISDVTWLVTRGHLPHSTTTPRPKKPDSANGKILDASFADGSMLRKHLKKNGIASEIDRKFGKPMSDSLESKTSLTTGNSTTEVSVDRIHVESTRKETQNITVNFASDFDRNVSMITDQLKNQSFSMTSTKPSTEIKTKTIGAPSITLPLIPHKPETTDQINGSNLNKMYTMSRIQFPYIIVGTFLFVTSAFFLILHCYNKSNAVLVRPSSNTKQQPSPITDEYGFRIQLLVLLFVFFFMYVGMEVTFGAFIMSFAVQYFDWSKDQGALLTSLFWGSLTAGRGLAIFIAKCCLPSRMLIVNILLVLCGSVILSFGLEEYQIFLWGSTMLFGLGLSSIFQTGISWAEQYITLTGKTTAVFIVGSAFGEMVVPAITGFFFETKDNMALMYIMLTLSLLSCLVYIIMQNLASNQKRKQMLQEHETVKVTADNSTASRRKRVTFKLDHERVKYNKLLSAED